MTGRPIHVRREHDNRPNDGGASRTIIPHPTRGARARRGRGRRPAGGAAQSSGGGARGAVYDWQRDVAANGQAIERPGALSLAANPPVTSLTGRGLSINAEGELTARPSPDVSTDAEGGQTGVVVEAARNIVAGTGLVARASGPGEATLDVDLAGVDADTLDGHDADEFVLNDEEPADTAGAVAAGLGEQQSVPDGGDVVVAFADVDVDLRDEFDADAGEFTAGRDGAYHVDVYVTVAVVGSSDATFFLRLERERAGSTETVGYSEVGTADQLSMSLSRVLPLVAGDVLRVRFSASGKDAALVDFGQRGSVLSVHQVG